MILSLAFSNSVMVTRCLLARAANNAASLTKFARSAPENPACRAMTSARHPHRQALCACGLLRSLHDHECRAKAPPLGGRIGQGAVMPVQNIGTVGCRHDNHAFRTVHFNQHLVEGLFALIVTSTQTGATVSSNRIELVDEDDARGLLACSNMSRTRTDTNKHLNEVRTGNREERYFGFTRDGFGKQRFTRSWRSNQQHAVGFCHQAF